MQYYNYKLQFKISPCNFYYIKMMSNHCYICYIYSKSHQIKFISTNICVNLERNRKKNYYVGIYIVNPQLQIKRTQRILFASCGAGCNVAVINQQPQIVWPKFMDLFRLIINKLQSCFKLSFITVILYIILLLY